MLEYFRKKSEVSLISFIGTGTNTDKNPNPQAVTTVGVSLVFGIVLMGAIIVLTIVILKKMQTSTGRNFRIIALTDRIVARW